MIIQALSTGPAIGISGTIGPNVYLLKRQALLLESRYGTIRFPVNAIDFQASSLEQDGYPIEVGLAVWFALDRPVLGWSGRERAWTWLERAPSQHRVRQDAEAAMEACEFDHRLVGSHTGFSRYVSTIRSEDWRWKSIANVTRVVSGRHPAINPQLLQGPTIDEWVRARDTQEEDGGDYQGKR